MAPALPARTRDYIGPVSDTRFWDKVELRPGDIVLSTPPKSGTTWSQALLMMLIHGEAVEDRQVWTDSIWLDCRFRADDTMLADLAAQPHRRCIKSHAAFDAIPYREDLVYFAVYRHPVDVHFSIKNHVARMKTDILDFLFTGDVSADFERFLTHPATPTGTDDLTLRSLLQHFESFHRWTHLPNVHLFHYADLKRDPVAQTERYARLAGLPVDRALAERIAAAAGFDRMKETATRHSRPADETVWVNDGNFFVEATSNKWEGRLAADEIAAYDRTLAALLPDAGARHWLENGSGG